MNCKQLPIIGELDNKYHSGRHFEFKNSHAYWCQAQAGNWLGWEGEITTRQTTNYASCFIKKPIRCKHSVLRAVLLTLSAYVMIRFLILVGYHHKLYVYDLWMFKIVLIVWKRCIILIFGVLSFFFINLLLSVKDLCWKFRNVLNHIFFLT